MPPLPNRRTCKIVLRHDPDVIPIELVDGALTRAARELTGVADSVRIQANRGRTEELYPDEVADMVSAMIHELRRLRSTSDELADEVAVLVGLRERLEADQYRSLRR